MPRRLRLAIRTSDSPYRGIADPVGELAAQVILAAFMDWTCTRRGGQACIRHQDLFQTCEECQADVAPFFAGSEAFYQWASLVTDDPGRLLSRLWAERERIMQSIAEPPLGAEGVGE